MAAALRRAEIQKRPELHVRGLNVRSAGTGWGGDTEATLGAITATSGTFTQEARTFAAGKPIGLIEG